nr:EAL domain-containing protein [uncultured Noviherbaspirillum sp.]
MVQHSASLYERFLSVLQRLVPKRFKYSANDVQKVETFLTASIVALTIVFAYAILYYVLKDNVAARLCWIAVFITFANVVLFRIFGFLATARDVLLITIFCLLFGLSCRLGGISAPTIIWFTVCPAAVIGSGGRKQGLTWAAAVFIAIVTIYFLDVQGYLPKPTVTSLRFLSVISTISFLVTITLVVTIFEQISTLALSRLDTAIENIRQEKEKAQVTLQSIGDAVITTDAEMVIDYLNPIAETLTGWTTADAKGLHMDDIFNIFSETSGLPAVNPIRECLEKNSIIEMDNHTILVRHSDNKEFHIEDSAAPIRRQDGSILGAVMVFHDVTERRLAQSRLQHIAYHDALTGLPNRAFFSKTLSTAISLARLSGTHVAVLFLDLDRFKTINDSLGHGIGDELLIAVAKRLKQCIRENDLVCRMGGDEFTAIINNIESPQIVAGIAEKISKSIGKPFNIQNNVLHVTTSIGITVYPDDGENIEALLKNADTAMYVAKDSGRGNYRYYDLAMREKADSQWQMENALHAALENNEFFLEYQPKLDLDRNVVVGSEALIRWQNPEFGRVMPSEFIPKLEESGGIISVGHWVMKTAIYQAKRWFDSGHPIVVSVNVSARQFKQQGLTAQISKLLAESGLPASLLQVEITESFLMDDAERGEVVIRDLREMGVLVALDDFGTGFSSLSYLRRFSIDELKIDRSFIVDMESNETAQKIVEIVIALGQALGMRVTAEGVETENQRIHLQQLGCDEIQGYFFSRPLREDTFTSFIVSHSLSNTASSGGVS